MTPFHTTVLSSNIKFVFLTKYIEAAPTGSYHLPITAWKVSRYFPYFSVCGLNTEIYKVNLRIQSECRKIRTRKNPVFGHFPHSEYYQWYNFSKITFTKWKHFGSLDKRSSTTLPT